jgi:hypothetical protein
LAARSGFAERKFIMPDTREPAAAGNVELTLPPALRKPRLRRWEVPEYLRLKFGIEVATATLAKWASVGGGPEYQKVNRTPLYPTVRLDAWAIEKLSVPVRRNTGDDAA